MRRVSCLIHHMWPESRIASTLTPQICFGPNRPLQQATYTRNMSTLPNIDESVILRRQHLHTQTLDKNEITAHPIKYFYKWLEEAISVKSDMPEKMVLSTVDIEEDGTLQPCARVVLLKDVCIENSLLSPYALIKGDSIAYPSAHATDFFNDGTTPDAELRSLFARGGFFFVTNYNSNKGQQLAKNPSCALNFHWPELERVVRVSGTAYKVPPSLSDRYHDQRPRGSQVAALTSHQSRPVETRDSLEARYQEIDHALRSGKTEIPEIEMEIPEKKKEILKENSEYVPRPENWGGYVIIPRKFEFWQGRGSRFHERVEVTVDLKEEGKWNAKYLQP